MSSCLVPLGTTAVVFFLSERWPYCPLLLDSFEGLGMFFPWELAKKAFELGVRRVGHLLMFLQRENLSPGQNKMFEIDKFDKHELGAEFGG